MTVTKPPIRIIKRDQRRAQNSSAEKAVHKTATANASAQDVKTTVSTWIREFQQQRQASSKRTFASLFEEQVRPIPQLS